MHVKENKEKPSDLIALNDHPRLFFLRQWAFIKSLYKPPPEKNKIVCACIYIYIYMYVKWGVDGGCESGGE